MKKFLGLIFLAMPFFLKAQTTYSTIANGTLNINECSGTILDSGGENNDYINNEDSYVTITGSGADLIELTFTEFDIEHSFDELFILAGTQATGQTLYSFTGSNLPNNGMPILIPGSVATIYFQSDFTVTAPGYSIDFTCGFTNVAPTAAAQFPDFTCNGIVQFQDISDNYPSSYVWDFGDGNTSTEANPIHTYTNYGDYTISLIACNSIGCDTISYVDAISYDTTNTICTGINIPADYTILNTSDCAGILYDHAGPNNDYSPNVNGYVFISPPGATSITITFLDFDLASGGNDFIGFFDHSTNEFFSAYYGSTPPAIGSSVTFNTSTLGVRFQSDHSFESSGFILQWQGDAISIPPVAAFSASTTNPPNNWPVQFTDQSNVPGNSFWHFGDGGTSSETNPTHTYTSAGTYTVNLTLESCQGIDTAQTVSITVQDPAAMTYTPDNLGVTIPAGSTDMQTVTICNNGAGDLALNINSSTNQDGYGYVFDMITNENGEQFSWQLMNQFGYVIEESQTTYSDFETIHLEVFGLDPNDVYYLLLISPVGINALQEVISYHPVTNAILFQEPLESSTWNYHLLDAPIDANIGDWLAVDSLPQLIAPATCVDYEVNFDATNLNGGLYEGTIQIASNDANNAMVSIPVSMTVVGIPTIQASTTSIAFGDVQIGAVPSLTFDLENNGSDQLLLTDFLLNEPAFSINTNGDSSLYPGEIRTIDVSFAPTQTGDYEDTLFIVSNAGNDIGVYLTGYGIPAPSMTVTPTSFIVELISGEDTTLNVNIANSGLADLVYDAQVSNEQVGFIFNFTTDLWGDEFSWTLTNSQGSIIQESGFGAYGSLTNYTEMLTGLTSSETYTLNMYDSWGDGALSQYSVSDIGSGQVIISGDFTAPANPNQLIVGIGSPNQSFISVSPDNATIPTSSNQIMDIYLDSDGMATGTYPITVTLETNDPAQPTALIDIMLYVIAPVVTNFEANPAFVCGNLPVQFTDLTTNVATSWAWDFGDGNTSTLSNPSHQYVSDGEYTVSLIACNSLGCDTMVQTNYIEVETDCYTQNIPLEHLTETITVCDGNVYDSGGPTGDYPEGNNGTLIIAPPGATQVSITFNTFFYEEHDDFLFVYDGLISSGNLIGSYTGNELVGVTLVANSGILTLKESTDHFNNYEGFEATFSCQGLTSAPIANFSNSDPLDLCTNEPILFTDISTGIPTSWFWDFGDGGISNEENPYYGYSNPGTYSVSLTVCNDIDCDTYINSITVDVDSTCILDSMPGGINGSGLIFACSGTLYDSGGENDDYPINTYSSVTIVSPSNILGLTFTSFDYGANDMVLIYDGPDVNAPLIGSYTGNSLPENGGTIFTSGNMVTIAEYSDFSSVGSGFELFYSCALSLNGGGGGNGGILVDNPTICDGERTFGVAANIAADSWSWNFGDGHTSTEANPTHTFTESGDFPISVEVCSQGDCQTFTASIYSNKLTPDVIAPTEVMVGEDAHFHGLTEDCTHWQWDFGNGETSPHHAPTTVYTEAGAHDVHIHMVNIDVHSTCIAEHIHTVMVMPLSTNTTTLDERAIKVFPNPASTYLELDIKGGTYDNAFVRILSMEGKEVYNGTYQRNVDVSNLTAGNYILELRVDQEIPRRFKIVVAK